MNNAKSREHAHTCRKARAIFKLRYKNKNKNNFEGSLDFTRLPKSIRYIRLSDNRFSGTVDLGNLPESMAGLDVSKNALSGTVRVPPGLESYFDGNEQLTVEHMEE